MTCLFNTYLCPTLHRTAVIESDEGQTPYLILCPECGKEAKSEGYSYSEHIIPTHEFYKPKIEELGRLSEQELIQYKSNVLFLRKKP